MSLASSMSLRNAAHAQARCGAAQGSRTSSTNTSQARLPGSLAASGPWAPRRRAACPHASRHGPTVAAATDLQTTPTCRALQADTPANSAANNTSNGTAAAAAATWPRRRLLAVGIAAAVPLTVCELPPLSLPYMVPNAAIAAAVDDGTSAGAAADPAATLAARVAGPPSDISAPWPSAPWAPRQIYYPKWMFGEWRVDSTYTSFAAPLGERFVAGPLLQAARVPAAQGGPGSTVTYSQRFFSTLPDTLSNQFRVNVGWMPEDAIIPDRAYNSRVMTNAFLGYEAVASVAYDPRDAPDRETVEFARQTPDGRTLPPKKTELYISNMRSAEGVLPSGQSYFVACECYRQVLLGVRQVDVTDYEVMNLFKLERDGQVVGTQRTAIYLEPRDTNYFNARGRAVAVYDYELQMTREAAPADAVGAVACVTTPKDFIQCI